MQGRESVMLRRRLGATRTLEQLHRRTLVKHGALQTPELEQAAHGAFRACQAKRHK